MLRIKNELSFRVKLEMMMTFVLIDSVTVVVVRRRRRRRRNSFPTPYEKGTISWYCPRQLVVESSKQNLGNAFTALIATTRYSKYIDLSMEFMVNVCDELLFWIEDRLFVVVEPSSIKKRYFYMFFWSATVKVWRRNRFKQRRVHASFENFTCCCQTVMLYFFLQSTLLW